MRIHLIDESGRRLPPIGYPSLPFPPPKVLSYCSKLWVFSHPITDPNDQRLSYVGFAYCEITAFPLRVQPESGQASAQK